jgi:hypothetical protein
MYDNAAETVSKINGSPQYLGTITAASATVVNNKTTATPFAIPPGSVVLTQWDSNGWMLPAVSQASVPSKAGLVAATAVTDAVGNLTLSTSGTNGLSRSAADEWEYTSCPDEDLLQVVGNGGTVNVKVFALLAHR